MLILVEIDLDFGEFSFEYVGVFKFFLILVKKIKVIIINNKKYVFLGKIIIFNKIVISVIGKIMEKIVIIKKLLVVKKLGRLNAMVCLL